MSEPAVDISDLRVDYDEFVAVDDLGLTIPRGEVMGWVGPNGAGKTSAFRLLTMLMEPTYGEVKLGGLDISLWARRVRKILDYMPNLAPVPTDLKVREVLDFYAHIDKPEGGKACRRRYEEYLDLPDDGAESFIATLVEEVSAEEL